MRALALVPILAACSTYAQQRTALIPHAAPLPWNGQPMTNTGEVGLGASNLGDVGAPTGADPSAGNAVPSTQLRGELAVRATDNLKLSLVQEHGLASTATPLTTSQPSITDDVSGYGFDLAYSIPTGSPEWRIGIATELLFWSVPWIQYTTCIDNCAGGTYTTRTTGSDLVPSFALALIPSYHVGRFTLFGGITLRNQPTLPEQHVITDVPQDPDVQAGPLNVTVHAGAEVALGGVRASVFVHQDTTHDPVHYGPGIGVMLAIPFGREHSSAAAAPPTTSGPPGLTPAH